MIFNHSPEVSAESPNRESQFTSASKEYIQTALYRLVPSSTCVSVSGHRRSKLTAFDEFICTTL